MIASSYGPSTRITKIEERPIKLGFNTIDVYRHVIQIVDHEGPQDLHIITKKCSLRERLVLWRLRSLGAQVPDNFTLDLETDEHRFLCMQDIDYRTNYGALDVNIVLQQEPYILGHIHGVNSGAAKELSWLPTADRAYVETMLDERWRPYWEKAVQNPDFLEEFKVVIPEVKRVADTIVDDMESLLDDESSHTLIHTDLHPGNCLVNDDMQLFYIDWDEAHYGTFYIDAALRFSFGDFTRAEAYRDILSESGIEIPLTVFTQQYRKASRYIGLRYMAWTLNDWHESPDTRKALDHYLNMVAG